MCAGRPSLVCDDEPLLPSSWPICWRNFPAGVNFKIWSPSLLPPSQTLPSRSTWMPCSFLTHGWPAVAPPQEASRLPSGSNFKTGGADLQHLVSGGLACAPFSSSSKVAGRWMIQVLSWPSTAMPETWPRIQFSGSGFGQNGSGWNFGAACWATASAGSNTVAATANPDSTHAATRALMAASLDKSGRVRKEGGGYLRRLNL